MDRIAADRAAFDTGAADVSRPDAAALGLSEAEIAKLPDVVWAPAAATNEDAGDASVRVDDGDEKDALEKKKKRKDRTSARCVSSRSSRETR